jgi:hypothetical protein
LRPGVAQRAPGLFLWKWKSKLPLSKNFVEAYLDRETAQAQLFPLKNEIEMTTKAGGSAGFSGDPADAGTPACLKHGSVNDPELVEGLLTDSGRGLASKSPQDLFEVAPEKPALPPADSIAFSS